MLTASESRRRIGLLTQLACWVHTMGAMRYLSEEWIEAADQAVKTAAQTAPVDGLTIDQHVNGVIDYRITISRDAAAVRVIGDQDKNDDADASFTQDRATAQAVAQGTTDAHQAFLLGHITFRGNINLLIERRDAFDWLATALAPVLSSTSFS